MKSWLTRNRLNWLGVIIASVVLCLIMCLMFCLGGWAERKETALWRSLVAEPEPERCALCESVNQFFPCLVSLSSGETGVIKAYRAEGRGFAGYLGCDGIWMQGDTLTGSCELMLPEELKEIDASHFCLDCRARLAGITTEGYVLADTYCEDSLELYPIEVGAEYGLREFTVKIIQDGKTDRILVQIKTSVSFA